MPVLGCPRGKNEGGACYSSAIVSQRLLFSGTSVFDVIETQKRRLRDEFRRLRVSDLDDPDLPNRLAVEYGMHIPVLEEDRKYAKKKDARVDVSHDPTRRYFFEHSGPRYLPGTELSIFVPFKGDPAVFNVRPSSFDTSPPIGDVIGTELCFIYAFVTVPANLTGEYDRTILQVKKYLDWLRPSAEQLEKELQQLVQNLTVQRKQEDAAHSQLLDSLGIPIREDEPPRATPAAISDAKARKRHTAREGRHTSWDVFICHASEDKDEIARPLADALVSKGLRVWYDELSLRIGDSLRQSIDQGLARSKFGIVILSPHFFEKHWPQQELNGLATRELDGKKVILPVWHKVGFEEVREYSPVLADRLAARTDRGLEKVVQEIAKAMW